jgi:hypothetical protein
MGRIGRTRLGYGPGRFLRLAALSGGGDVLSTAQLSVLRPFFCPMGEHVGAANIPRRAALPHSYS